MSQILINFNGHFIPHEDKSVSLLDRGLLYGDTLFETMRAEKNQILLAKEHLDRLCLSARLLEFPCERTKIENTLSQISAALKQDVSRLRLTLSRGSSQEFSLAASEDHWFALTATAATPLTLADRELGTNCVLAPNHRSNPVDHLPQMKRGNHADCLYAADFAQRHQAREALFIDQGLVIEGSSSNIFALFGEQLYTPPIGKLVLAGITRRQLISAAIEFGLQIMEEALPFEKLATADEIWLSNSMIELLPVATINNQPVARGSLWKKIHQLYKQRTADLTSANFCL